jgi:hypothetical protein
MAAWTHPKFKRFVVQAFRGVVQAKGANSDQYRGCSSVQFERTNGTSSDAVPLPA